MFCSDEGACVRFGACDTGADQGLVADELEGEADQDRREGGEPRTLCRLPNGGGRHPTTTVPGAFDCHAFKSNRQEEMRPDASENSQVSCSTIVRAARAPGSRPHLASVLQQGRKSVNICVSLGVIRGNPGCYNMQEQICYIMLFIAKML